MGTGIDRGILRDRAMACTEGKQFVVFLIGMRVNKLWAVRRWMRVAMAMRPMLKELYSKPDLGFLSGEPMFSWMGITMVQYWRSAAELQAYASARDSAHFPAWTEFYRRVGRDGSVGIWHETYIVNPGAVESIYVNMPPWGLTRAFGRATVAQCRDTARQRLDAGSIPRD